jgi:zinc/manganese transport system substrate-binding protein
MIGAATMKRQPSDFHFYLLGAVSLLGVTATAARTGEAPLPKKLVVVCTLPTLAALAEEVGGDRIEAVSLAKGDQDPHFVSPTPVLMQKTRGADLFIEVGMSLELWADAVVAGSGNPAIAAGRPGRVVASAGIPALEVPERVSRELGDIHPQGNPHLWLDPVRAKRMAANIARALETVSPSDRDLFRGRLKSFGDRIDAALYGEELIKAVGVKTLDRLALDGRLLPFLEANETGGRKLSTLAGGWLAKAAALRGVKAIEYHRVWVYFARIFGLDLRGTIEERPGIPPGPQHLARITAKVREEGVRLILTDNFYEPSLPNRIAADAGARVAVLPNQVRGERGADTYFALLDHVLGSVSGALEAK